MGRLVHELVARIVVARIEAIKIALHFCQLLFAVLCERPDGFIASARFDLGGEVLAKAGQGG